MDPVVQIDNKIENLRPALDSWLNSNNEYCIKHPKDCLYWHGERTAVGTLAGAIWKCDGFALEDYCSDKKYKKATYSGRTDLWFTLGNEEYLMEAKYDRFSIWTNSTAIKKRINENLRCAIKDVNISLEEGVTAALGIAFIVPVIPPSAEHEKETLLRNFYKSIGEMGLDLTTVFKNPNDLRNPWNNYLCPAVALVGKLARK